MSRRQDRRRGASRITFMRQRNYEIEQRYGPAMTAAELEQLRQADAWLEKLEASLEAPDA